MLNQSSYVHNWLDMLTRTCELTRVTLNILSTQIYLQIDWCNQCGMTPVGFYFLYLTSGLLFFLILKDETSGSTCMSHLNTWEHCHTKIIWVDSVQLREGICNCDPPTWWYAAFIKSCYYIAHMCLVYSYHDEYDGLHIFLNPFVGVLRSHSLTHSTAATTATIIIPTWPTCAYI